MEMEDAGHAVAFARFDASGSNKLSWMSAQRIQSSSWDDFEAYIKAKNSTVSVNGLWVLNIILFIYIYKVLHSKISTTQNIYSYINNYNFHS